MCVYNNNNNNKSQNKGEGILNGHITVARPGDPWCRPPTLTASGVALAAVAPTPPLLLSFVFCDRSSFTLFFF